MPSIPVLTPNGDRYTVSIGSGLLERAGEILETSGLRPGPAALVSNPPIAELYAEAAMEQIAAAGFAPHLCTVAEGESYKTLASIASLYDQFVAAGLDRSSPVISLGGGVVGDMAGFAAASYLRGVPFVQIPTTLLAMVDASVGGKTGVDLPQGKNLVGAFKQPAAVLIDTDLLASLPPAEFRSGLAEIVKHGIIGAPQLYRQLEQGSISDLSALVAQAVQVKVDIVAADPFEQGRRALLNLGHTFGHAIEHVSGYAVRHGEAVAVGMVAAAEMASALELCDPQFVDRLRGLLHHLELPTQAPGLALDDVHKNMYQDKKRRGRTLRLVLPRDLGDVVIVDDPGGDSVRNALARVLGER